MNRLMRAVAAAGSVAGFLLIAALMEPPAQAQAQADEGAAASAGTLPPAEILAGIRREGFYPVGRPVQHGGVYVLFAVDQDDFEVALTVDAASGQVLWVTGAVAHFGSAGFYGSSRPLWWHRPQAAPADMPTPVRR